MVTECFYCGEKAKKNDGAGRTFHKFPLKQPDIKRQWIENMGLGPDLNITQSMRLCSDHFPQECLQKAGVNVTLTDGSIPIFFMNYKSACVYCKATKQSGNPRTFHKFPHENPVLLDKWIRGLGFENCVVTGKALLCSDHFEKNCFRFSGRGTHLRLRNNSVPTIFEPRRRPGQKRQNSSESQLPAKHCCLDEQVLSIENESSPSSNSTGITDLLRTSTPTDADTINSMENVLDTHVDLNINSSTSPKSSRAFNPEVPGINQAITPKTRRQINVTQHDHQYENTPRTVKKKLQRSQLRIKIMREEARIHKQQIARLKHKVATLKDIVSELRKTRALPEPGLACLDSVADTDISEFLKRYAKNRNNLGGKTPDARKRQWKSSSNNSGLGISRDKYPPALRSFAITLHFYSPKAYGFVRRKFCNALPDPSTLRSWYSTINGEPGFTSESFDALELRVSEARKVDKEVLVSFMLDEISIKKGMQYLSNGTVRGYVDIGSGIDTCNTVPLAKDALVMMAVSLDSHWKIPLGYFLINGIDSPTNAGLITDALTRLHHIGVRVVSVTLDGPPQHFSTMRLLGASFDMPNPKPYFQHPSSGEKVHILFDACHMLKLTRNCLGDYKDIKDGEGNLIQWKYITSLANLQDKVGLRAGNRLRKAHISYWKMKMKVALAAQTLSSSVADAIQYCDRDLGLQEFKGSEATVRFIKCIDQVFDFLNSRNPFAKGYKAPLRRNSEIVWRPRIFAELDYLRGITDVTGTPLWKTKRYVPIVGLITATMSVIEIFDTYVKPEGSQLKYLLTYKLSQDHLELFFCAIRSCGGWCPNPTCTQFVSSYKRLLVRHEVAAVNGNAEAMDSTRVLTVSSSASKLKKIDRYDSDVYDAMANIRVCKKYGLDDNNDIIRENEDFMSEFLDFGSMLPTALCDFSKGCVAFIAGWVVKKLVDDKKLIIRCEQCRYALFQQNQRVAEFDDNRLIQSKTRGGLMFPSNSVVQICQHTEKLLRNAININQGMTPRESNFQAILCSKVMRDLLQAPFKLFPSLEDHLYDDAVEELSNHIYFLIKEICKAYIKLRLFAINNIASQAVVGTKLRHHMTRQIIWQNQ